MCSPSSKKVRYHVLLVSILAHLYASSIEFSTIHIRLSLNQLLLLKLPYELFVLILQTILHHLESDILVHHLS